MKKIRKVVDNMFNKLGYYKPEMPEGSEVSTAEVMEMYKSYGENEMFVRHLRDLCRSDKNLHFQASNDRDRDVIHGAYQRANYFISLIQKTNDKRNKESKLRSRSNKISIRN